jgi:hypothetical protein
MFRLALVLLGAILQRCHLLHQVIPAATERSRAHSGYCRGSRQDSECTHVSFNSASVVRGNAGTPRCPLQNDPQQHQREAKDRKCRASRGPYLSPDSESAGKALQKSGLGFKLGTANSISGRIPGRGGGTTTRSARTLIPHFECARGLRRTQGAHFDFFRGHRGVPRCLSQC